MDTFDDLAHWRKQVLNTVLNVVLALGVLIAIPSTILFSGGPHWPVGVLDAVALAWLAFLRFKRHLNYRATVLQFVAIVLLFACGLMVTVGPTSELYMAAAPVLAALLLSTHAALLTLLLGSAAVFIISATGIGAVHLPGLPQGRVAQALLISSNYAFISGVITLSCTFLLQRLVRSLAQLQATAASLQEGKLELHAANAELGLSAAALSRLSDMVVIARIVDAPGARQPIIFVNDAFERRSGRSRQHLLGSSARKLLERSIDTAEVARFCAAIDRRETVAGELRFHTGAGADADAAEACWIELELKLFADAGGVKTHWVGIACDITARKKAETHIHQLAFYDVLTGLPNRRLLMERLAALLAAAAGGGHGALMFIDLDNFKVINDAMGHAIGDHLLTNAAERLKALMAEGDTVARLGGDEFVVLLGGLGDDAQAARQAALQVAETIRHAVARGFAIGDHGYQSSASIGVTLVGQRAGTVQDLLREADTAMYHAKAGGRNQVALFETAMHVQNEYRLKLQEHLAAALGNGELSMHLQLQVDQAGTPTGAELLMRWRRADGTLVAPERFIPPAEESGLIIELGQFALRSACEAWHALARAGHRLALSVNVSPMQFRQPEFVDAVRALLREMAIPANELTFEVTEGLFVDSHDSVIERMHQLVALGIRMSIDDFGTGYSSLAYLTRMPLFELKIDRSVIRATPGDANDTAIVQSIIAMAGHLGLHVVAEGVETGAQARFLADNGGPGMQGYLFSRPMPLDEVIGHLDASRRSTT
ncbi:putative bifunctional diguanylate cyclase/phosphodiesterase [Massilia sp. PWRC2]|uniref:putative bifunctional diguanylate cyclase/phosphodiesterase n=1 Tax=Massilia sp. PWRC2 TaxID=2804626 RepID=UPI003CF8EC65